ncbi:hypothetical protein GLOIN_2v1785180 [Rhizophagus irregularis DAOM 181602=DAOM 197198]|nr:hypothetical protein GLOIN_2v1785180 [Rhizophagus irregularis DAOM 181602=DAOM 197198]
MASSHDFSTLSWDEVLSKLREVEDFCAKFRKGFRYPPVDDHPSHDDPIIDNLPSLPLAIWASKHEADPNIILDLCTPSTRRTNRLCPSQRTPKFLCKRVSSMISPASFKCAQKIKTKLSFTRLVLSPSTIRLLVPPLSCPSEPKSPFQNTFPDSSLITPRISALEDIADYDHNVPSPVLSLNSTPAGFLLATSTSAPLLHDNVQCSSYTFTIRTILDGWIRPARNIGSNRLYSIRRGNCYFLLDSTPDSDNCYSIHTNSPLLSTTDPFQFISDHRSKFSRHVVHPDLLDSSMWMATKDHAIVIPPTSYNLTISTTDYSIVQNIRNLVSSHPDVSFCLKERSPHSSVAFLQAIVLNPSSVVASHFITDKPMSGPFVGLNCPVIDYQNFKTLGFSRSIIDMHNTSSVSKKFLCDAIQSVITKSASSSTFSHLWNSDTRFSFKLGRVKPCDILMLLDVCAPWFDSHPYPASSDFRTPWDLPADFVHPIFLMR